MDGTLTDCEGVAGLLPWLGNGTLDAGEAAGLREHLASCARCREEWESTRKAADVFSAHIPTPALVGHVFGDADPALPRDVVEAHLADCEACAHELAMVRESRAAESASGSVGPPHRRAPWLAPALAAAGLAAVVAGATGVWIGHREGDRRAARSAADVARLEGRVATLSAEVGRLEIDAARREADQARKADGAGQADGEAQGDGERQADGGSRAERLGKVEAAGGGGAPIVNPPVVELVPATAVERGGGGRLVAVARAPLVTLILVSPSGAGGHRGFGLELRRGGGRVWGAEGLVVQPGEDLTLALPGSMLEPGSYELVLRGGTAGRPELLATYRFVVR
jgi:hypothetical protein